jgi:hypothetical protein
VGTTVYHRDFVLRNTSHHHVRSEHRSGNAPCASGSDAKPLQYADEINYQIGKHTLVFDAEFIRTQVDGNWGIQNDG